MSTQAQLFDSSAKQEMRPLGKGCIRAEVGETGRERKRQGQARAAGKHSEELADAQNIALELGRNRQITIEDVRKSYEIFSGPWTLGNAAGMVFDPEVWECVGRVNAKRPEAHHREIKVWRLRK